MSVGEVYVAGQVMRSLREACPGVSFVLSTTSSTGWKEAEKQVGPEDVLIYNPVDFTVCVRRALDAVRPRALILTESEIWPNLIRLCCRRGVPLFLVNARISDRSAPGYRRLRFWFGPVLRMF
ncbi:MAG: glycosyltransferase N-terminal domain-containing protein, partial [Kiritimatiellae bacterium]|nr:glycosyltransferase N-terminal domain-containing protein [Kiritimatiellia bacterium]